MISAFARAARVLGEGAGKQTDAARASRAAEFLWSKLRDPSTGELKRRWREGEAAGAGQLDDYAYTIFQHPKQIAWMWRDGGWEPEQVADQFDQVLGQHLQHVGMVMPHGMEYGEQK